MNPNDATLHLWFKPHENVMNDSDVAMVNGYGKRFYPHAVTKVAEDMRKVAVALTRMTKGVGFEYQMRHFTYNHNKRYAIEESLRDVMSPDGFSISIQNTNTEERRLFIKAFDDERKNEGKQLSSVMSVVAYLQDSLHSEAHLWDNAKLHNGQSAVDVMLEVINFLISIKNKVKVYDFSMKDTKEGRVLTMALVCPGTLSYYTRIDWNIV